MSESLYAALGRLPRRQLHLLAGGVIAIGLMATWTLALRVPLQALRTAQARLAAARVPTAPAAVPASARAVPKTGSAAVAPATMLAFIELVSRSAARHGIDVATATPLPTRSVAGLRELPLEIGAAGNYGALQAWLDDIERTIPNAGVAQLHLGTGTIADKREGKVRLSLYVPEVQP